MSKYNGWTNYSTWRINLEIFDGSYEMFEGYTSEILRDAAEEILGMDCENSLTLSYALAFLQDVNWDEIKSHIDGYNDETW